MSVLVLVPVLNRPHRVRPVWDVLRSTPGVHVLFVASQVDLPEVEALAQADAPMMCVGWDPGPGDYARKINAGYWHAYEDGYEWVFTGADDLTFHDGWLDAALAVAAQTGAAVIGTNDLWNPSVRRGKHSTHSLVNVGYVTEYGGGWDGPGVLLHEGYDHQCVDNELCHAAQMRGRWAFAKNSVVEHLHPFAKKSEMDDTYRKALARGREDIALFQRRKLNALAEHRRFGRRHG